MRGHQWLLGLGLWMMVGLAYAAVLQHVQPGVGTIDEDQAFILHFDQPVTAAQLTEHSYCQSSALGERIPLQVVPMEQAQALLQEQSYMYEADRADQFLVMQCAQRLASGSELVLQLRDQRQRSLVPKVFYGDQPGLHFQVRGPLRVQLWCDKTRSTADCNPLRPLRLQFSAPVPTAFLTALRLRAKDGQQIAPVPFSEPVAWSDSVEFPATYKELATFVWDMPATGAGVRDDAQRALSNPDFFQLPVKTAAMPPLLKFAYEGMGVIERFAEHPPTSEPEPALVPVAIRGVDAAIFTQQNQATAGQLRYLHLTQAQDMLQWYARLQRVGDYALSENQLEAAWRLQGWQEASHGAALSPASRSIFTVTQTETQQITLPAPPALAEKETELIGVPLSAPGFYVLEAQSSRLGEAYLSDHEAMYVRSAVLLTNLAVHSKMANGQLRVWVTRLDNAQPVAQAQIMVLDGIGNTVAQGVTDDSGQWAWEEATEANYYEQTGLDGYFISAAIGANHADAYGQADQSFVMTSWDRGLEAWRFQLPYYYAGGNAAEVAHTVVDRPLFLAGETAHFKHYWRGQPAQDLSAFLPEMRLRHVGSGAEFIQPLHWQQSSTGAWYAENTQILTASMLLGTYEVWLQGEQAAFQTASLRVEAFKRPYIDGRLALTSMQPAQPLLVGESETVLDAQLHYIAGGVAAHLPLQVSALLHPLAPDFAGYEEYDFNPVLGAPRPQALLDKKPLFLDHQGSAQMALTLPAVSSPQSLVMSAEFRDPSGQIQTLTQQQRIWPSQVVVGVRHAYWEESNTAHVHGVVLSPSGQTVANQPITISAQRQSFYTTRQRMVGGFYRYEHHEQRESLGRVCQTQSDGEGRWQCVIHVPQGGQLILHSQSLDAEQRPYTAETQLWLGDRAPAALGANHDRMDILADKKSAQPGDTVRFQVQMPFEQASAWVAVERDRILHTQWVSLTREQPYFDLTVEPSWGPNVYVSVLAVRGRQYAVSWRDLIQGDWKTPLQWYQRYKSAVKQLPTTTVDLAKPSFRYGVTRLAVANHAHTLQVSLQPEQSIYRVGQTARFRVQAQLPSGEPAANASVLLVGVDQALLALRKNTTWDLLGAMYPEVGYGVRTATMQSEVVGRRHYGRKAIPAGGGGGQAPTRQILDSLLVWRSDVTLDDQGQAIIEVPLNQSLTQFEIVALVDTGGDVFGAARTQIQTHQPIQILSALPQQIRAGDTFAAEFTLRNREPVDKVIRVQIEAYLEGGTPWVQTEQVLTVAAQSSHSFSESVQLPAELEANQGQIHWKIIADEEQSQVRMDALELTQHWQAAVPVRQQQVLWQRLLPQQSQRLQVSRPAQALTDAAGVTRGQVVLALYPSLAEQQGARDWFKTHSYSSFEQQISAAVALQDEMAWQQLMQTLPSYLDEEGLVRYFPNPYLAGSAELTAYLLQLNAKQSSGLALPPAVASQLVDALWRYVQGQSRQQPQQVKERVAIYMAAVNALAAYDRVQREMLDVLALPVQQWLSSALIDGLELLQHPRMEGASIKIESIQAELQKRLLQRGSLWTFEPNQRDYMPSLMMSAVTNQARLILAVMDLPQWQDYLPGLMHGLLAQQQQGHWGTAPENSWALLALARLDQQEWADGFTLVQQDHAEQRVDWSEHSSPYVQSWSWAQQGAVTVLHQGSDPIWAKLSAEAAVPISVPVMQGVQLRRVVTPLQQAQAGRWQVGDRYRVEIEIETDQAQGWTVLEDPIPAAAMVTASGGGLLEQDDFAASLALPSYEERLAGSYRAYFDSLPVGVSRVRYEVQLNTAGGFVLPATELRVLYDASVQAQLPLTPIQVYAQP